MPYEYCRWFSAFFFPLDAEKRTPSRHLPLSHTPARECTFLRSSVRGRVYTAVLERRGIPSDPVLLVLAPFDLGGRSSGAFLLRFLLARSSLLSGPSPLFSRFFFFFTPPVRKVKPHHWTRLLYAPRLPNLSFFFPAF